jgi:hypothetical protein
MLSGLLENTEYEVQVQSKCPDNSTSSFSSSVIFTTLVSSTYCNSQSTDSSAEYISMTRVNGNPHTSGASNYSDFTNFTFQVTRGQTNLALMIGTYTGTVNPNGYAGWIDYNEDGVFDNTTELVFTKSPNTNTNQYLNITPSATVSLGVKRMRVAMKRGAIPTPCETFSYGEVEDYSIEIVGSCSNDTTAPVADLANLPTISAQCEVTSLTPPTATDNCAGSITGTTNATLPITSSTTITWTYDDGNSNVSTQTQSIAINDTTAPVANIANLPTINAQCEVTSLTPPTATDNCAGSITGTTNATLPITSSTTITWTYDDGNSNVSTQTQEVSIIPINNSITQNNEILTANAGGSYTYQWIDCSSNSPISGETNQTFIAPQNGQYAVEISNGVCEVLSDCITVSTLGQSNFNFNKNVMIYPNPSNGYFTVKCDDFSDNIKIDLFDYIGKRIFSKLYLSTNQIDLQVNQSGIYFLRIQNGNNKIFVSKIIIK